MQIQRDPILPEAIPTWFPHLFHVVRETDRNLHMIDDVLHRALDLDGVDPRVRTGMRQVCNALYDMQAGLTVVDMLIKRVLAERIDEPPGATNAPLDGIHRPGARGD